MVVRSRPSLSHRSRRPPAPTGEVGTDWQVRIQPSATSSSSRASLTCILTLPSTRRAMQVAQLPASHGEGRAHPHLAGRLQDRGAGTVHDRLGAAVELDGHRHPRPLLHGLLHDGDDNADRLAGGNAVLPGLESRSDQVGETVRRHRHRHRRGLGHRPRHRRAARRRRARRRHLRPQRGSRALRRPPRSTANGGTATSAVVDVSQKDQVDAGVELVAGDPRCADRAREQRRRRRLQALPRHHASTPGSACCG